MNIDAIGIQELLDTQRPGRLPAFAQRRGGFIVRASVPLTPAAKYGEGCPLSPELKGGTASHTQTESALALLLDEDIADCCDPDPEAQEHSALASTSSIVSAGTVSTSSCLPHFGSAAGSVAVATGSSEEERSEGPAAASRVRLPGTHRRHGARLAGLKTVASCLSIATAEPASTRSSGGATVRLVAEADAPLSTSSFCSSASAASSTTSESTSSAVAELGSPLPTPASAASDGRRKHLRLPFRPLPSVAACAGLASPAAFALAAAALSPLPGTAPRKVSGGASTPAAQGK
jgi:hypothetical protein